MPFSSIIGILPWLLCINISYYADMENENNKYTMTCYILSFYWIFSEMLSCISDIFDFFLCIYLLG